MSNTASWQKKIILQVCIMPILLTNKHQNKQWHLTGDWSHQMTGHIFKNAMLHFLLPFTEKNHAKWIIVITNVIFLSKTVIILYV